MIPFNKPFISGKETEYIEDAVRKGKLSGNGEYTKKCQSFFEQKYGFKKCLLTTSCTDALEMCAILANIEPGDEVIIPSYTFVSTALAFVRQGAKIVFADSEQTTPNIDVQRIEDLINSRTKAIVPVHYAGVACDMDKIMEIAHRYNLLVIEDAAQAIESYYKGKPLGSIGHLSAFSFHETKNIIAGEGGMICINDENYIHRAEIIWEKGTNRAEFFRGEINKYGWVDTGSSFLPSEITSAFLWAQIENMIRIQAKRLNIWKMYNENFLNFLTKYRINVSLPHIPAYATNNAHMYYLICNTLEQRSRLITTLKEDGVMAVFHYLSLHSSDYYQDKHDGRELIRSDYYTNRLVRLPIFYDLTEDEQQNVINSIERFMITESSL